MGTLRVTCTRSCEYPYPCRSLAMCSPKVTYGMAGGTLLWPSLPCLGGCVVPQHPISTLRAVARSSGGGAIIVVNPHWSPSPCHHPYAQAFLPMSSCSQQRGLVLWVSLSPPCPCHHAVLHWQRWCWCHWHWHWCWHHPPLPLLPLLAQCHCEMVTGLLAPVPPYKQGLTVVGGRCWATVSSLSSLHTWHSSQAAPTIHPTSSFS